MTPLFIPRKRGHRFLFDKDFPREGKIGKRSKGKGDRRAKLTTQGLTPFALHAIVADQSVALGS